MRTQWAGVFVVRTHIGWSAHCPRAPNLLAVLVALFNRVCIERERRSWRSRRRLYALMYKYLLCVWAKHTYTHLYACMYVCSQLQTLNRRTRVGTISASWYDSNNGVLYVGHCCCCFCIALCGSERAWLLTVRNVWECCSTSGSWSVERYAFGWLLTQCLYNNYAMTSST